MRSLNISVAYIKIFSLTGGRWSPFLALFLVAMSCGIQADDYQEGVHYRQLEKEAAPVVQGPVEVEQWFWYGCASCAALYPLQSQFPAGDLIWVRRPAQLRYDWYFPAKAYHLVSAMSERESLERELYRTMVQNADALSSEEKLVSWMAQHGVDEDDAQEEITSPLMNQLLAEELTRQRELQLRGVPAVVIDGRYLVDAGMVRSQAEFVDVVRHLIEMARQSRAQEQEPVLLSNKLPAVY